MKAVGYVRVSTIEQAQEGVSLDAQEARIRAYAEMQHLELVKIVREEGISATIALADRPGGRHSTQDRQVEAGRYVAGRDRHQAQ